MIAQKLFLMLTVLSVFLFAKKAKEIRRNIFIGKNDLINDHPSVRWNNVMFLALGQKKMFKNPLVAVMHLIIYGGFIIINIEILEIVLDGLLGTHRLFASPLGGFYTLLINAFEILAVLVIVVCAIFLIRRNIIRLNRFASNDLNGWPRSDANYILFTEIVLMSLFIIMNACDFNHSFLLSQLLKPLLNHCSVAHVEYLETACWWIHIIGIFAFLNYLPYSKHLHIILAFPNAYYTRLTIAGKLPNMPEIQQEVLYAMQPELAPTGEAGEPIRFGAKDVFELGRKNLMDAYSCTECGRCTAACPANITGKLLSPRAIMMKTRDRLEEVGKNINTNKTFIDDNKSLLRDYIAEEELRACTTCNACVEACPVSISPLDIIVQMRRYLIMEESSAPTEWNGVFGNIENNFAPWKFSPDDRDLWVNNILPEKSNS